MAENETKNERFKRIASKRVTNAISKVELIGKLSSYGYEYSAEDIEKIFTALQETLDNTKALFSKTKRETKKFEL